MSNLLSSKVFFDEAVVTLSPPSKICKDSGVGGVFTRRGCHAKIRISQFRRSFNSYRWALYFLLADGFDFCKVSHIDYLHNVQVSFHSLQVVWEVGGFFAFHFQQQSPVDILLHEKEHSPKQDLGKRQLSKDVGDGGLHQKHLSYERMKGVSAWPESFLLISEHSIQLNFPALHNNL